MTQMTHQVAHEETVGILEIVAQFDGPMPTGISVSREGRVFVNFPKWGDEVEFTVAEIVGGEAFPYPNAGINKPNGDADPEKFVSVQSIVVDPRDRLWVLDTGSPMFKPTVEGGPKLVGIDLDSNTVFKTILFPKSVALETTYLNDIRFDLRRGEQGFAFITDSSSNGPNALIVIDLASGQSWRRLNAHPSTTAEKDFLPLVEGQPLMNRPPDGPPTPMTMGADGIAMAADGSRLYYCPLASRRLYSVSLDALIDRSLSDGDVAKTVRDEGDKGGAADGLESDDVGRLYITSGEHNAILRRDIDHSYHTLAHDPRMLWPDTLSLAHDGYLYFTANQLHRQASYHGGKDLRQKPYSLFRIPVDARPVELR